MRAGIAQQLGGRALAALLRLLQGCVPVAVGQVQVGTGIDQLGDDLLMRRAAVGEHDGFHQAGPAQAIDMVQINVQALDGSSALLLATRSNQIEIARALIQAGADVNQKNLMRDSPYLLAGASGRNEILQMTLSSSPSLTALRSVLPLAITAPVINSAAMLKRCAC